MAAPSKPRRHQTQSRSPDTLTTSHKAGLTTPLGILSSELEGRIRHVAFPMISWFERYGKNPMFTAAIRPVAIGKAQPKDYKTLLAIAKEPKFQRSKTESAVNLQSALAELAQALRKPALAPSDR